METAVVLSSLGSMILSWAYYTIGPTSRMNDAKKQRMSNRPSQYERSAWVKGEQAANLSKSRVPLLDLEYLQKLLALSEDRKPPKTRIKVIKSKKPKKLPVNSSNMAVGIEVRKTEKPQKLDVQKEKLCTPFRNSGKCLGTNTALTQITEAALELHSECCKMEYADANKINKIVVNSTGTIITALKEIYSNRENKVEPPVTGFLQDAKGYLDKLNPLLNGAKGYLDKLNPLLQGAKGYLDKLNPLTRNNNIPIQEITNVVHTLNDESAFTPKLNENQGTAAIKLITNKFKAPVDGTPFKDAVFKFLYENRKKIGIRDNFHDPHKKQLKKNPDNLLIQDVTQAVDTLNGTHRFTKKLNDFQRDKAITFIMNQFNEPMTSGVTLNDAIFKFLYENRRKIGIRDNFHEITFTKKKKTVTATYNRGNISTFSTSS